MAHGIRQYAQMEGMEIHIRVIQGVLEQERIGITSSQQNRPSQSLPLTQHPRITPV